MNKPLIISHRGETKNFVENTIAASEKAIELGATGLEIDVRQCGSGEIVVFHDFSLKRMFNKNGYVGRTEYNILKNYNYIKNGKETNYTIDLLDEFLDKFKNSIRINLDAKTIHFFDFKFADQLNSIINNHHLFHSIWISCFNPFLLQILKLKNNKIQTGYLFQRTAWLHTFYDKFCYTDAWHPHINLINDNFVKRAKSHGKKLYVWTVNTQIDLKQIMKKSIDGIITDDVKLVVDFL